MEGEPPNFIILRKKISKDGTLTLCFMGESIVRNLIKEGRAKGRAVKGDYKGEKVPYRVLDISRPELISMIREVTPEKLFRWDVGPFRRLSPTVDKSS